MPAAEWQEWVAAHDGIVIDVRQPEEWEEGTLPGAKLVSLLDLPGAVGDLDPERATLLVCSVGGRSQRAAVFLVDSGFATVANLAGGMKALTE